MNALSRPSLSTSWTMPNIPLHISTKSLTLRPLFLLAILLGTIAGVTSLASAQAVPSTPLETAPRSMTEGDKAWSELLDAISTKPSVARGAPSQTQASGQNAGPTTATSNGHLANADYAQAFYKKYPKHAKAAEAQKIEATMLLHAVFEGDSSLTKRKNDTADAFIKNAGIPEELRAQVAGLRAFFDVFNKHPQQYQHWTEFELVARQLIRDFPRQPQGYESLLTVATSGDENRSKQLASELIASSSPPGVKQQAQVLLNRLALLGQPLDELLKTANAQKLRSALISGKPTIVYSWATWSPESLALGQLLAQKNLKSVNVIGINLDTDTAAANTVAAAAHLPGTQNYDPLGVKGSLTSILVIDAASSVYFIDGLGRIGDVRGEENLAQKLTKLGL